MRRVAGVFAALIFLVLLSSAAAFAQSAAELARIAEEKAARTSDAELSWDDIYAKLDQACSMLQKRGLEKGLARLQGNSTYVFKGTYVWVHDLDYVMLMHPMKPGLVGENIKNNRDSQGKLLFQVMNERVAVSPGNVAFVDYYWPKPGVDEGSFPKRSVVQLCDVQGKKVILGCGKYLE